jgi:CDP-diacylglycerol--serine O-phosphatidyltransferase
MKWLIRLTRVDCITVLGLMLALASAVFTLKGALLVGAMALVSAMICDAHDGYWARRLNVNSPFGPALDSLVDVVTYLVSPVLFLYAWGLQSGIHLLAFAALIGCGILRLAVFTSTGFDESSSGGLYYRGLPVFWIPFWLLVWIAISPWVSQSLLGWAIPLTALPMSIAMIWDHRQFKPRNIKAITLLLVTIILILGAMTRTSIYTHTLSKDFLCLNK